MHRSQAAITARLFLRDPSFGYGRIGAEA